MCNVTIGEINEFRIPNVGFSTFADFLNLNADKLQLFDPPVQLIPYAGYNLDGDMNCIIFTAWRQEAIE
jgi:hypothetical protein